MQQSFDINKAILFINNYNIGYQYTKKELKVYYEWFMANIDNHLRQFSDKINSFGENVGWVNDFTPESLKRLGYILYANVNGIFISEEEYQRRVKEAHIVLKDSGMHVEMTYEERVLTFLMSVYIGEVIIRNNPDSALKWELSKYPKSFAFCGHMLIKISEWIDSVPIEPANWLMIGILQSKYENKEPKKELLYNYYYGITKTLRE